MQILLVLVGLVALAGARPHSRNHMLRRPTEVRRQATGDDICQELSAAAGNLIHALIKSDPLIPESLVSNPDLLNQFVDRAYGFDFINDTTAREEFYCAITSAKTVSEMKMILDDEHDYNYRMFRLAYDYISMIAAIGVDESEFPYDIGTLQSLGLLSLDSNGTALLGEITFGSLYSLIVGLSEPVAPSTADLDEKCETLQGFVHEILSDFTNKDPTLAVTVLMATGIDIKDIGALNTLICQIMSASADGLEAVYQVIDNEGIIVRLYQMMYPMMRNFLLSYKQQLEMQESMMMEQTQSSLPAGPPPGLYQYGSYDYPGQYDYYGGKTHKRRSNDKEQKQSKTTKRNYPPYYYVYTNQNHYWGPQTVQYTNPYQYVYYYYYADQKKRNTKNENPSKSTKAIVQKRDNKNKPTKRTSPPYYYYNNWNAGYPDFGSQQNVQQWAYPYVYYYYADQKKRDNKNKEHFKSTKRNSQKSDKGNEKVTKRTSPPYYYYNNGNSGTQYWGSYQNYYAQSLYNNMYQYLGQQTTQYWPPKGYQYYYYYYGDQEKRDAYPDQYMYDGGPHSNGLDGPPPGMNGPPPGMNGPPPGMNGPPPGMNGPPPGMNGPPPGMGDYELSEQYLILRYLRLLEASGLLSLN